MKTLHVYIIVGLLSFLLYANTITHEYVWDDQIVITLNETTKKGISGLKEIWTSKNYIEDRPTYRPIPQSLHAIEWQFFPNTPMVGHLTTILAYVFCVLSFLFVLKHFFPELNNWLILFIGSLFSLLPVHSEVVANIKSLDEILSALFVLWSIYFSSKIGWKNLLFAFLFLILSFLSKISAITLIPIIFWFTYRNHKKSLSTILNYIIQAVNYIELLIFALFIYTLYIKLPYDYHFLLAILVLFFALKIKIGLHLLTILQLSTIIFLSHLFSIEILVFLMISFIWFYKLEDKKIKLNNYKLLLILLFLTLVSYESPYSILVFFVLLGLFQLLNYLIKKEKISILIYILFLVVLSVITTLTMINEEISYSLFTKIVYNTFFIIALLLFYFIHKKKNLKLVVVAFFSFSLFLYVVNLDFSELLNTNLVEHREGVGASEDNSQIANKQAKILVNQPYHNVLVSSKNNAEKVATICRIQLVYLKKLFFPFHLVHQHGTRQIEIASWKDWDVYFSILLHLLLLVGIYYFYKKKNRPVFLGLAWYFITMSIYTNIVVLMPDTLAERFLFLPSFGYCVAVIYALYYFMSKIVKNEKSVYIVMTILLLPFFIYYSYKTIDRNKDWKNNYTLSANTLPYASKNAAIHAQYAHELSNLIKYNLVENTDSVEFLLIKHYNIAANLFENFYSPNSDLASFFISKAEPDSAFPYLLKASQLEPDVWSHHYFLGLIYFERSKYAEAVIEFEAVKQNEGLLKEFKKYPELLQTIEMQAQALHKIGKDEQAYLVLEDGISLYQQKSTYVLLANFYRVTGKQEKAIAVFKRLLILTPNEPELINTIEYLEKGLIY